MAQNTKVKTVVKEGEDPQPIEILESAIVELAAGYKRLANTRLKRWTMINLLHAASPRVSKTDIDTILANLDNLEDLFLKKKER